MVGTRLYMFYFPGVMRKVVDVGRRSRVLRVDSHAPHPHLSVHQPTHCVFVVGQVERSGQAQLLSCDALVTPTGGEFVKREEVDVLS